MRMFDVQAIEIAAPRQKVFEFVGEPRNLPRWAHAFVRPLRDPRPPGPGLRRGSWHLTGAVP
jgi:uncharacterized protein YndB with AHSA1/START domain